MGARIDAVQPGRQPGYVEADDPGNPGRRMYLSGAAGSPAPGRTRASLAMTRFAFRPTAALALALTLLGLPFASDAAAQIASPAPTKGTTLRPRAALAGPHATTHVMGGGTSEPPAPPLGATTTRSIQPDGTIVIRYAN